jgi:hypothetical protein
MILVHPQEHAEWRACVERLQERFGNIKTRWIKEEDTARVAYAVTSVTGHDDKIGGGVGADTIRRAADHYDPTQNEAVG